MTHDDNTTPPEVRQMVDRTLQLLQRRVGAIRTRPQPSESIMERLELIRRRAEATKGRD